MWKAGLGFSLLLSTPCVLPRVRSMFVIQVHCSRFFTAAMPAFSRDTR